MSFGTQTFGSETYGSVLALSVTAISPAKVSRAGGDKVTLTGSFSLDKTYAVTVDGVPAYSGVSGQGNVIVSLNGTTISFVVPPIGVGAVTVEVTETPGGSMDTIGLSVLERVFAGAAFAMRQMFPSWYAAGPRRLDLEPPEVP